MRQNDFDKDTKYKLYRTLKEILHPTISKKNISNYSIIIDDSLLPLRVFYPKKVTEMKDVIIFIHGDSKITKCEGDYSKISDLFQNKFDSLVISLDYNDYNDLYLEELYNLVYETVKYIYNGLIEFGFDRKHITFIGDSTGASNILYINRKDKDLIKDSKEILFYPLLSGEYFGKSKYKSIEDNKMFDLDLVKNLESFYTSKLKYKKDYKSELFFALKGKNDFKYPDIRLICGNVDPLIDEARDFASKFDNVELSEICFGYHGFINSKDDEIIDEYIDLINEILVKND